MDSSSPERDGRADGGGVQGSGSKRYVQGLPVTSYVKKAEEPAPKSYIPFTYVKDGHIRTSYVEAIGGVKDPKQALAEDIVGFCSVCHAQVQMTFPGGFDVRDLDKALHGTPVKAICPACERLTEFLPAAKYLPHPMVMKNQRRAL